MSIYVITAGQTATLALNGDTAFVEAGGTALDFSVVSSVLQIEAGGTAVGTMVNGTDAYIVVLSGGTATDTSIVTEAVADIFGSATSNTVDGGIFGVDSGGSVTSTTLTDSGTDGVNGIALDTSVGSDCNETTFSGGTTSSATVAAGGTEVVEIGGTASNTTVYGVERVTGSGAVSISGIVESGGLERVKAFGQISATTVMGFGYVYVSSGGVAISAQLQTAAEMSVSNGGSAVDTMLSGSSDLYVESGGTATGTIVYGVAGPNGGGSTEFVEDGGVATSAIVMHGADEYVGSGGISISATIEGAGQETLIAGVSSNTELAFNAGEMVEFNGMAISTTVNGTGSELAVQSGGSIGTVITAGADEDVSSKGFSQGTIVNNGGVERLEAAGVETGLTLNAGGAADLRYLTFVSSGAGTLTAAGNTLIVKQGGVSTSLLLAGSVTAASFTAAADGNGGTLITATGVACYVLGTRLLTGHGERAIQELRSGDRLVVASGGERPIRWIGRRSYAGRFLAANPCIQPICFTAGSLGRGLPRRDLLVSPEHAMCLDGMLIPARCLVNGTTIAQQRGMRQIEYFHVELDRHEIILAEGAASETFLDDDSRTLFHNAAEYAALYPGAASSGTSCAPKLEDGYALERIRQRLTAVESEFNHGNHLLMSGPG